MIRIFTHSDFEDGKQVLAWQRGFWENIVVTVANFSDYDTSDADEHKTEYAISNFSNTPAGKQW